MVDIILHFQKKFAQQPELREECKPAVQSSFTLTHIEEADYTLWSLTNQSDKMAEWLREQVLIANSSPFKTHAGIDFYQYGASKGFRLHPALTKFSDSHCKHFFIFMKERFLQAGYKVQTADKRLFKRGYFDETICRFVLKPGSPENTNLPLITLEMVSKNNHLALLHLITTAAGGEIPHATNNFSDLLERVLTF